MHEKLESILDNVVAQAEKNPRKNLPIYQKAFEEISDFKCSNQDKIAAYYTLALIEFKVGCVTEAYQVIAEIMIRCAKTGDRDGFQLLLQGTSLDTCRDIIIRHYPHHESIDNIFCALTGFNNIF